MKKLFLISFSLFVTLTFLFGCSLSNTPTSKVEDLFSKYQRLDNDIDNEIDIILNSETLTDEQNNKYRKIIENQYKNLVYEIKDETIDGDSAVVVAQIEVLDYKKVINELGSEKNKYDIMEYNNLKIEKLEKAKEKVAYTLNINLIKEDDGNWKIKYLSDDDIKKMQGMY